ncbi:MAG: FadR family transcriptional regulator [Spirochaetes bacterium]|nr:FadR family transcriptional regulator [Spirochaetota bacterium]
MFESRSIRRPSLTDIVVERIRSSIRNGDLKSGDRLPSHEELSERWGISRTTIREALNKLESLGVLAKHQGRGTYLLDTRLQQMLPAERLSGILTKEGVLELLEARKMLEISIAGLAAERRSEQDLASLGAVLEEMTQCLKANDHVGHSLADNRFHLSISKASQNSFLQAMMRNLQDALVTQQKEVLALSEKAQKKIAQESLLYHKKIHGAIEQQDTDQAKRFMRLHLESVERFMRESL